MKENGSVKNKILPFVLVICIAALLEIFVMNFRSYQSLFYKEKLLGEYESFVENDEKAGISSLFINTRGDKINNIFLNMAFLDAQSGALEEGPATIAVQESGGASFRTVAEKHIEPEKEAEQYVFWGTKGGTEQIRIDFPLREGKSLRLFEVKLNARRPLFFSYLRFLILAAAGILCYNAGKALFVKKDKEHETDKTGDETDETRA